MGFVSGDGFGVQLDWGAEPCVYKQSGRLDCWVKFLRGKCATKLATGLLSSLRDVGAMTRMFCSKEGTKREIKSARTVVFKGGHRALKGTCSSCGRVLTRPMW